MIPPIMLRSTALVSPMRTSGAYGNVYEQPVRVKCRLEKQLRKNGNRDSQNLNMYVMFCNPHPALVDKALIEVDGRTFIAEDVQEVPGLMAVDHLEVMLSGCDI